MRKLFYRASALLAGLGLLFVLSCQEGSQPKATAARAAGPKNSVRIYTHRYLVQDQEIFKAFEERAQAKVEVIALPYHQLIAEAESNGLANGDLVILGDLAQMKELERRGLLQSFSAGIFEKQFSSRFLDIEGYWSPLTRWTMGYVYHKNRVNGDKLKAYQDIAMPELKGKVVMSPPDSSGLISLVAAINAVRTERVGHIWVENLVANLAYPPRGNDYDQIQAVVDGKADVALVSGSSFYRYRYSGNPEHMKAARDLGFEIPYDVGENNYYNISPIALLRNAPHRDYAIAMIEWLSLTENQQVWAEAAFEYPVNNFAVASDFLLDIVRLPEGRLNPHQFDNQTDAARKLIMSYLK